VCLGVVFVKLLVADTLSRNTSIAGITPFVKCLGVNLTDNGQIGAVLPENTLPTKLDGSRILCRLGTARLDVRHYAYELGCGAGCWHVCRLRQIGSSGGRSKKKINELCSEH